MATITPDEFDPSTPAGFMIAVEDLADVAEQLRTDVIAPLVRAIHANYDQVLSQLSEEQLRRAVGLLGFAEAALDDLARKRRRRSVVEVAAASAFTAGAGSLYGSVPPDLHAWMMTGLALGVGWLVNATIRQFDYAEIASVVVPRVSAAHATAKRCLAQFRPPDAGPYRTSDASPTRVVVSADPAETPQVAATASERQSQQVASQGVRR